MTESEEHRLAIGDVVAGRYELTGVLGVGGFGTVYRAKHLQLRTSVALKVLHPEFATNGPVVGRFLTEARTTAAIGHRGVVSVSDLGQDAGVVFIAMEMLDGEELADMIVRDHPMHPQYVAKLGAELADAVEAAHKHGVIHRDLKPQNVFMAVRGDECVLTVLDFGIAKLVDADRPEGNLTRTGEIFGTPRYMSPEQLRSTKNTDARSDVYAIGTILYEALTGQPPFTSESYSELVIQICTEGPVPIEEARLGLDPELREIVQRAMAIRPDDRFQSSKELRDALRAYVSVAPEVSRREGAPAFAETLAPVSKAVSGASRGTSPLATMALPDSSLAVHSAPTPEIDSSSTSGVVATPELHIPRSRIPIYLVVGALGVALATAGLAWSGGFSGERELPTPVADSAAPTIPEPVPEGVEPDSLDEIEVPEDPPTVRPVAFNVTPAGTAITVNGDHVCDSPCTAELPDVPSVIRFRRDGYADTERVVSNPLPRRITLQLEAETRHQRRSRESPRRPPPLPER